MEELGQSDCQCDSVILSSEKSASECVLVDVSVWVCLCLVRFAPTVLFKQIENLHI